MTANRRRYVTYIQSYAWKAKRNQRLKLDNWQCQHCHSTEELTVHHQNYDRFGDEKMNDLLTLCESCHFAIHHPNHHLPNESRHVTSHR
jgi:5-methylcytosine-specific restriction endonuclease McrA